MNLKWIEKISFSDLEGNEIEFAAPQCDIVMCQPHSLFQRLPDRSVFLSVYNDGVEGIPFWVFVRDRSSDRDWRSDSGFNEMKRFAGNFNSTWGGRESRGGIALGCSARFQSSFDSGELACFRAQCALNAITWMSSLGNKARPDDNPERDGWLPPPQSVTQTIEYEQIKKYYTDLCENLKEVHKVVKRLFSYFYFIETDYNKDIYNAYYREQVIEAIGDLRYRAGIEAANLFFDSDTRSLTLIDFRRTLEANRLSIWGSNFLSQFDEMLECVPSKDSADSFMGDRITSLSEDRGGNDVYEWPNLKFIRNKLLAHQAKGFSKPQNPFFFNFNKEVIRDIETIAYGVRTAEDILRTVHAAMFQDIVEPPKTAESTDLLDENIVWTLYDILPNGKFQAYSDKHFKFFL